jgi:hypothetical protein
MPPETADQAAPSEVKGAESLVDQLAKGFDQAEEPEPAKPEENIKPEGDDTPEEPSDGLEDVEYEGQTYKVPAALKEAIITKADYTTKSQEVANARRNVELLQDAMKAAHGEQVFESSISGELRQLAHFEAKQKDLIDRWNTLSSEDKQEIYLLDKQAENMRKQIDGKRQQFRAEQQKTANDLKAKAMDVLRKSVPNFNEKLAEEISKHAVEVEGYTRAEIDAIWDPRHAKTLWKAYQYDKLQKAAVKTPKTPAVIKAGASNPMPAQVKNDLNLRKAQKSATTSSDKAKVIQARLEASFAR